jgi:hypothetical protein
MLCMSGEAGYIHEPFNPRRVPGWSASRIPYWYLRVTPDNGHFYEPIVEDILSFRYPFSNVSRIRSLKGTVLFASDAKDSIRYRLTKPRPLLKDPIALFASEWLADRFDAQVVVMIRDPVAFAGSIKRLDWQFRFRSWLAQPALADGLLSAYRDDMLRLSAGEGDIVDQAIVMWNAIHEVIDDLRSKRPDWSFIRHEDLASAPLDGFARLYQRLGLHLDAATKDKIASFSTAANPGDVPAWRHGAIRRDSNSVTGTWRSRLTDEEIERVRKATARIARLFYFE